MRSIGRGLLSIGIAAAVCPMGLAPARAGDGQETGWRFCRPAPESENGPEPKYLDVPGGNIFGFTDPSDVGDAGDCGFAVEFTGRAGKRHGSYFGGGFKYELSATVTDNLALAFSPFTSWYHVHKVPDLDDRNAFVFDGLSTEVQYRFLSRNADNPLALTIAAEPRWARSDPTGGGPTKGYGVEFKLFADIPLSEKWFAAGNLNYAPAWAKAPGASWGHFSATNLSAALTWGPDGAESRFFLGVESRLLAGFNGLALGERVTWAWFAGPTLAVSITENAMLNASWTPQIVGRERGTSTHRDLDNFERQQFRIKLAIGL